MTTLLNGLVAYYNLDETSGATLADETGTYPITHSGTTLNQTGKIGKAITINATINNFNIGYLGTNSSINFWHKYNSGTPSLGSIFEIPVTSNRYHQLLIDFNTSTNKYYFNSFSQCIGTSYSYTITDAINPSNYNMVTVTWDSSSFYVYVNGVYNGTFTKGSAGSCNATNWRMGRYTNQNYDEIGIWNRTLTSDEVSLLYNRGFGLTYPFENSKPQYSIFDDAVAYYDFSKNALDVIGENNGIVTGACLPADTKLFTSNGQKKIVDINKDDVVLSFDNNNLIPNKVNGKIYSGYRDVFKLKTKNRTIEATDNHPFLTVSFKGKKKLVGYNKENKHPYHYYKNDYEVKWKQLKDLKKGDAIYTYYKQNDIYSIDDEKYSENFLRFVGAFLGDGSYFYQDRKDSRNYTIHLHLVDDTYIIKYSNILNSLNINHLIKYDKNNIKNNGLKISSKKLCELFIELGLDKVCKTKRVPEFVWKLPINKKKALLEGMFDSDGCINITNENRATISIQLANQELLEDLRNLAIECGYRVSNILFRSARKGGTIDGRVINGGPSWSFYVYPFRKKQDVRIVNEKQVMKNRCPKVGDCFELQKIVDIEYIGKKDVYDIEVDNSHNFIAEGIVVHNSLTTNHLNQSNSAYSFDGTDDWIDCGNFDPSTNRQYLSVFSWIKTNFNQSRTVIGRWSANGDPSGNLAAPRLWHIGFSNTGVVNVAISNNGKYNGAIQKSYHSVDSFNDGNWHFVGFTWSNGTFKLFVDGIELTGSDLNKVQDDSFTQHYDASTKVRIGAYGNHVDAPAAFFNGSINLPMCFNKAFSADEVKQLYNLTKSKVIHPIVRGGRE